VYIFYSYMSFKFEMVELLQSRANDILSLWQNRKPDNATCGLSVVRVRRTSGSRSVSMLGIQSLPYGDIQDRTVQPADNRDAQKCEEELR
jgi:hypothetical protein